jgi:hypothetical protein
MRRVSKRLFSIFLVLSLLLGLGPKRILRGEGPGATLLYHDSVPRSFDVWDFGGQQFENTGNHTYNNKLTVADMNAWYSPDIAPGTIKVNLPGDILISGTEEAPELVFKAGGSTSHRLRSTTDGLTKYDNKFLTSLDDPTVQFDGLYLF